MWASETVKLVGFNPTLVRLRPAKSRQGRRGAQRGFNPTLVRLRHPLWDPLVPLASGFNPTLVRLRLMTKTKHGNRRHVFQSHAGSIEAAGEGIPPPLLLEGFNPTLVRLRPQNAISRMAARSQVSIPRWFD